MFIHEKKRRKKINEQAQVWWFGNDIAQPTGRQTCTRARPPQTPHWQCCQKCWLYSAIFSFFLPMIVNMIFGTDDERVHWERARAQSQESAATLYWRLQESAEGEPRKRGNNRWKKETLPHTRRRKHKHDTIYKNDTLSLWRCGTGIFFSLLCFPIPAAVKTRRKSQKYKSSIGWASNQPNVNADYLFFMVNQKAKLPFPVLFWLGFYFSNR